MIEQIGKSAPVYVVKLPHLLLKGEMPVILYNILYMNIHENSLYKESVVVFNIRVPKIMNFVFVIKSNGYW